MTLFALGLFVSLFLLWRAVLPLECKWYWKLAAGSAAFAVGFKFKIIQLLGGNYFAPELPAGVLLAAALIYVTAFFFLLFIAATDTVLFCITCSRTLYRNLKEKKHDFTPLLRKHPLLNKIHAAGLAGAFLFAIAGICNGLAMPRIRQVEVISDRVPAESDGLRLAVLADLHVDRLNDRPRIRKIVALTNSLKPDLICLAGDFSDGAQKHHLEALSELAALRARYGVYGVPGNHEYYRGYHELMAHFKKTGLPMLINENVYFKDLKLLIGGIPDGHARKLGLAAPDISAALSGGDPQDYRILLSHTPKTAREAAKCGADLQFSGHTHGGMVWGFDRLVARSNAGFAWGTHQVGRMILVMSNGTCIWSGFPVRLGRPAEILLVTLRRSKTN